MSTYNPDAEAPRFEYAARSLEALYRRLHSSESLAYILADDGSPHPEALAGLSATYGAAVVSGEHLGIGGSLNRALDYVNGPWMYTTDDWLLTQDLDLDFPMWLLDQGYDMVRLGPIHPNLLCFTRFATGHGWWLDVKAMYGGFAFATRPFLASANFIEKFGPFDERLNAYETERLYAERIAGWGDRVRLAAINLAGPWEHIGEYEVGDRLIEEPAWA